MNSHRGKGLALKTWSFAVGKRTTLMSISVFSWLEEGVLDVVDVGVLLDCAMIFAMTLLSIPRVVSAFSSWTRFRS